MENACKKKLKRAAATSVLMSSLFQHLLAEHRKEEESRFAAPLPSQGREMLGWDPSWQREVLSCSWHPNRACCVAETSPTFLPFLFHPLFLHTSTIHYHPVPFPPPTLCLLFSTQSLNYPFACRNTTPGSPQTGSAGS